MKDHGIASKRRKKFKATTNSNHKLPVAKNLIRRNFKAKKANRVVGDVTYIHTGEGWLYLATCIDLYSRKIVGWSMSSRMTSDIVVNAFRMATFKYCSHCHAPFTL
jgi:putative transposase